MQGSALPVEEGHRDAAFVEWNQASPDAHIAIDTVVTRDHICSLYRPTEYYPEGTGELYICGEDPAQWWNRWDDPACTALRRTLLERIEAMRPPAAEPAPLYGYA